MTYIQAIKLLAEAGIDSPETDAAIICECFASIPRHTLPFRKNEEISSSAFFEALARRCTREPLQYIIGSWNFCGLNFKLNPDCLCPRPDTELIVELAIKFLPHGAHFCDIGTGSGAIAISVLHFRPDTIATAFDISTGALSTAAENAAANGVTDRFSPQLADALAENFLDDAPLFDAIISNPPYIPESVIPTLSPEVRHEPHRALDGGKDGLDFYRAIIQKSQTGLKSGGFILFEVGIGQSDDVAALGRAQGFDSQIYPDLSGIPRAVLLTLK